MMLALLKQLRANDSKYSGFDSKPEIYPKVIS